MAITEIYGIDLIELYDTLFKKLFGRKFLKYKIKRPVHLENYLKLINNENLSIEPNIKMYTIVVPITQEFYYKGQKYYAPKEWLEHITRDFDHIKSFVTNFYLGMPDDELKNNITDIFEYNYYAIRIMEQYLNEVNYMSQHNMFCCLKKIED